MSFSRSGGASLLVRETPLHTGHADHDRAIGDGRVIAAVPAFYANRKRRRNDRPDLAVFSTCLGRNRGVNAGVSLCSRSRAAAKGELLSSQKRNRSSASELPSPRHRGPFRAEIQGEVRMRGGETSLYLYSHVATAAPARRARRI